jgi:hypothetical protein
MTYLLDRIIAACAGGSDDAGITFMTELAPDEPRVVAGSARHEAGDAVCH